MTENADIAQIARTRSIYWSTYPEDQQRALLSLWPFRRPPTTGHSFQIFFLNRGELLLGRARNDWARWYPATIARVSDTSR